MVIITFKNKHNHQKTHTKLINNKIINKIINKINKLINNLLSQNKPQPNSKCREPKNLKKWNY